MINVRSRPGRLLGGTAIAVLLLGATISCSYLKWRRDKSAQRRALEERPWDLALRKEYAPQDCFGLVGRLSIPRDVVADLLVAAFDHDREGLDLVGSHEIAAHAQSYGVLLPSGTYDILIFADLNHDGFYESDEVVARTPPKSPVLVAAGQSADGVLITGPSLAVDLQKPQTTAAA